ncbi:MAG: hypothetical protein WCI50_06655 [Actinomycetes bacterium]
MVPTLDAAEALEQARTGDIWLFRGPSRADQAIRLLTNSPVNHVAMVVQLEDLPPLLWHTEMGRTLEDVWSGEHHRGAQLNRLDDAIAVWTGKYDQRAFVRHFDGEITREMEDALLRVVAEYEARPFPPLRRLAGKWLSGRLRRQASAQAVYCAELLAITFTRMGLLDARTPANWFDPGRFWSGDRLAFLGGASLGPEFAVGPSGGPGPAPAPGPSGAPA